MNCMKGKKPRGLFTYFLVFNPLSFLNPLMAANATSKMTIKVSSFFT